MAAPRNIAFDILKGIGILLVIVGHIFHGSDDWRIWIYTFHMPLFFLVSGYFFKQSTPKLLLEKNLRRLILPYVVTSAFIFLTYIPVWISYPDFPIKDLIAIPLLWVSGAPHPEVKFFSEILPVTQLWFLWALAWALLAYGVLRTFSQSKVWVLVISLVISVVSTIVGRYVIFFPLGLMEGLSAMIFIAIGAYIKEEGVNKPLIVLCVLAWVVCIIWKIDLVMAMCIYDNYVINVLGGCGGTFVLYMLSKRLSVVPYVQKPLAWLGVNSLAILCMHTIESHTPMWEHLHIPINELGVLTFILKVSFCVLTTYLLSKCKWGRSLFGIKN